MESLKQVSNSEEFYFQKLEDVFFEYKNFDISESDIKELINSSKETKTDNEAGYFKKFLENNVNGKEFIKLIGQIISMCDSHAYNKREYNLYDDKRVLANSSVRQNIWVEYLLKYKLSNNIDELPDNIKNAIIYIENPQDNLTQLSIKHRQQVSKNILKKEYNVDSYFESLRIYFKDKLAKYNLKNPKNLGRLISDILYSPDIKARWENDINYWLVGSIWDGTIDKTDEFIKNGVWINGLVDKYKNEVININIGDKIAIKSSYTKSKHLPFDNNGEAISVMKIKAIGKVVENLKDGQNIKVSWDENFHPKEIYSFSYRRTISKIDKDKWAKPIKWIFEDEEQDDFFSVMIENEADYNGVIMTNLTLNQILYGPPGTGKTYNTVIKALEIIEPDVIKQFKSDGETYENYKSKLLPKYNELKEAGQIEFVTFHQSYGYEEFVEGIKPIPVGKLGNETEQMIYDVVDGIFKKICNNDTYLMLLNKQISSSHKVVKLSSELVFVENSRGNVSPIPKSLINNLLLLVNNNKISVSDISNNKEKVLSLLECRNLDFI